MSMQKKRGLGKGLDALLSTSRAAQDRQSAVEQAERDAVHQQQHGELRKLPIDWLQPGKYQPRKDMSAEALDELAASIKAQGVIQPIVVRAIDDKRFEIIAGERRWRAARLAGLVAVPCIINQVEDDAAVAIALIENIQREDLNAIEEAVALERLMTEFALTHQQVADAVGKSRSMVSNLLRLNSLNEDVKILVEHAELDMGHARALLALSGEQQSQIARQVADKGLTVRETEQLVKKLLQPAVEKVEETPDPQLIQWQERISQSIGSQVSIKQGKKGSGKVVIDYKSAEQLERLVLLLNAQ